MGRLRIDQRTRAPKVDYWKRGHNPSNIQSLDLREKAGLSETTCRLREFPNSPSSKFQPNQEHTFQRPQLCMGTSRQLHTEMPRFSDGLPMNTLLHFGGSLLFITGRRILWLEISAEFALDHNVGYKRPSSIAPDSNCLKSNSDAGFLRYNCFICLGRAVT